MTIHKHIKLPASLLWVIGSASGAIADEATYTASGYLSGNASNGSLISSYMFADLELTRASENKEWTFGLSTVRASVPSVVTVIGGDPESEAGQDTLVNDDPTLFSSIENVDGYTEFFGRYQYRPNKQIKKDWTNEEGHPNRRRIYFSPGIYFRGANNDSIGIRKNNVIKAHARIRFDALDTAANGLVEDAVYAELGVGYFANGQNNTDTGGALLSAGLTYKASLSETTSLMIGYMLESGEDYQRAETVIGLDFWFTENVAISLHNTTIRYSEGFLFPDKIGGESDSQSSLGIIFKR